MIPFKSSTFVLIGVSIASASIIGLIFLYRKKQSKSKPTDEPKHKTVMFIPNSCVPYIFGKYGCVLERLQNKCSTSFSFTPPGLLASETKCVIKGDPDNVKLAESVINNIVRIFTLESRSGVNFEEILNKGGIRIDQYNLTDCENEILTDVLKLLSANNRTNDALVKIEIDVNISHSQYDEVQHISYYKDRTQKLVTTGADKRIPIYVSAVAFPSQFWVQALCTKEHGELDQMTQDLYDHFDFNSCSNLPPAFETVKVGNLYAAYVEEQKTWYRVEVVTINPENEENPLNTEMDLYFLDYGFSSFLPLNNIRILPLTFLGLNFQAIECCAANVKPSGDDWTEEAIEKFEELTHSSMWYKLHAIVENTLTDLGTTNPVPCLTLIDSNNDDLNINDEMVAAGFARYST